VLCAVSVFGLGPSVHSPIPLKSARPINCFHFRIALSRSVHSGAGATNLIGGSASFTHFVFTDRAVIIQSDGSPKLSSLVTHPSLFITRRGPAMEMLTIFTTTLFSGGPAQVHRHGLCSAKILSSDMCRYLGFGGITFTEYPRSRKLLRRSCCAYRLARV
jgi:hypothetical protein